MADEVYRAVFLRVHPTGKMVLSLTTEADGHEADYAQLVAEELGVPPLDVKVGDRILFGKYSGSDIHVDGQEYMIMKEDEILGVLTLHPVAVKNGKKDLKEK